MRKRSLFVALLALVLVFTMFVWKNETIASASSEMIKTQSSEISADDGEVNSVFIAGIYEGEAQGYTNPIKVRVTVTENEITEVETLEHGDTQRMFEFANSKVPSDIVKFQSLSVDTFSGATFSSLGIINATINALEKSGADINSLKIPIEKPVAVQGSDQEADIVVIGGGASGLGAAIEAAKHEDVNPSILVLEKMSYTGGSMGLSGGLFWTGYGSKFTPEKTFTPESLVEWFEMRSEGEVNKPLVRHIAEVSGAKFDYLMDNGAPWDTDNPTETYPASGIYRFETNIGLTDGKYRDASAGNLGAQWLADFATNRGVVIRTDAKVTSILTDDSGAVIGVQVESPLEQYKVMAKKVIVATGGFGNSRKHLERFAEDSVTKWPFLHAGNTGDGHDMLESLGARFTGYGVMAYEALTPTMGYKGNVGSLVWVPELIVNKEGKRFVNETGQSTDITLQTYLQTDDISYGIIDSTTDRIADLEQGVSEGLIYKANTLEELASQCGISDVETFVSTVESYNRAAAGEQEDEFNADLALMKPVKEAAFYAVPIRGCIIGTMPGVIVDENCAVLDANGKAIPNLFACGEVMFGNIFNRVYPATGTAIAQAIYTGSIAAEQAINEMR